MPNAAQTQAPMKGNQDEVGAKKRQGGAVAREPELWLQGRGESQKRDIWNAIYGHSTQSYQDTQQLQPHTWVPSPSGSSLFLPVLCTYTSECPSLR